MPQQDLFNRNPSGLTSEAQAASQPACTREGDAARLGKQLEAVKQIMASGRWRTLDGIQRDLASLGIVATTQSISARLRDLRKEPLRMTVARQRIADGLYEYRVTSVGDKD